MEAGSLFDPLPLSGNGAHVREASVHALAGQASINRVSDHSSPDPFHPLPESHVGIGLG